MPSRRLTSKCSKYKFVKEEEERATTNTLMWCQILEVLVGAVPSICLLRTLLVDRFAADAEEGESAFKRKGTRHVKKGASHKLDDDDDDDDDEEHGAEQHKSKAPSATSTKNNRRGTGFPKGVQMDEEEEDDDGSSTKHVQ